MEEKIFELKQELIKSQDSFKDAILSELDVEKHNDIIESFSKKDSELSIEMQKEIEKEVKRLEKEFEDNSKNVFEEQEDTENTNDNHPLVNTFKKLVRDGNTIEAIAKQFKEEELIDIGREYNLSFTNKGSKTDKVKIIIKELK